MGPDLSLCRRSAALAAVVVISACASSSNRLTTPVATAASAQSNLLRAGEAKALARADSAWRAGSYALARSLYEAILAANPASSISVFRIATLLAWDDQLDQAIPMFRRYVALEPRDTEGRIALARALGWSGRYSAAIAVYDSIIGGDNTYRDAVLARAQTLAWSGRFDDALASYKEWQRSHPSDHAASLGYARTLSWTGQLEAAQAEYSRLAAGGDVDAQKGLARVIGWRGDLAKSESEWRRLLQAHPTDAEAFTGLAEVLRIQGRQDAAATALAQALRFDPSNGDARALLRWVQADLRPSVNATAIGTNDSDHNSAATLRLDYMARAPWNGTVGVTYLNRTANFAAIDSRADAGSLFARWQHGLWDLRAEAGATHHSSNLEPTPARRKTLWTGGLHATGNVSSAITAGASLSREAFDETALLIASGVSSTEMSGEFGVALPGRLNLAAAMSRADLEGGSQKNARLAYSATLRWACNRRWSIGVGGRRFGYDTTSADGYFAPRHYTLVESTLRGGVGGVLGWNADGEAGLGRQTIEFFGSSANGRLAERLALSVGYRFDPAHELGLTGGYANVAQPGQTSGSEYRAYSMALKARIGL